MSTLDKQLRRLVKCFTLFDFEQRKAMKHFSIPQSIRNHTIGIMFFKKVPNGVQYECDTNGVFMKKLDGGTWSYPISIHILQGEVLLNQIPFAMGNQADILILINDPLTIEMLLKFDQTGLHQNANQQLLPGAIEGGLDDDNLSFTLTFSSDPSFAKNTNFAYSMSKGHIQGVKLEKFIVQTRETSNKKFYHFKTTMTAQHVIDRCVTLTATQQQLVSLAQARLVRFMYRISNHADENQKEKETDNNNEQQPQLFIKENEVKPRQRPISFDFGHIV